MQDVSIHYEDESAFDIMNMSIINIDSAEVDARPVEGLEHDVWILDESGPYQQWLPLTAVSI